MDYLVNARYFKERATQWDDAEDYTVFYWRDLNEKMRNGLPLDEDENDLLQEMLSLSSVLQIDEPLYRGFDDALKTERLAGDIITFTAPTSTSMDMKVAQKFALRETKTDIALGNRPEGWTTIVEFTPGLSVSNIFIDRDEWEVLLMPDFQCVVNQSFQNYQIRDRTVDRYYRVSCL